MWQDLRRWCTDQDRDQAPWERAMNDFDPTQPRSNKTDGSS
jgi:hypothetical protein